MLDMLYVYEVIDYRETNKTEEEIKTIKNCKELKQWNEYCYIGKEPVLERIKADYNFNEFIMYKYYEMCYTDININIPQINHNVELPIEPIIEIMINGKYLDRIYNASNLFIEIETIMKEVAIDLLKGIKLKDISI